VESIHRDIASRRLTFHRACQTVRSISLVLNTPAGHRGRTDAAAIRVAASGTGVACITTIEGCIAALRGVKALRESALDIAPLQS